MKNAIIIHGMPSKEEYAVDGNASEQHWIPWLKEVLLKKNIETETPEMPVPYEPNYQSWKSEFEKLNINEDSTLIGHSCGAGFLVRWLSENKINVGKVVLVGPWMDPDKELGTSMFDFVIDPDVVSRTKSLTVIYSTDDMEEITKTVDELKAAFPGAVFKEYMDKGHFTLGDLGTREFPEILEVLGL